MSTKNTSAMQFAKNAQAKKKNVRIKDGKKGHYRSEAIGCSYSRKMARDPLWVLLNS